MIFGPASLFNFKMRAGLSNRSLPVGTDSAFIQLRNQLTRGHSLFRINFVNFNGGFRWRAFVFLDVFSSERHIAVLTGRATSMANTTETVVITSFTIHYVTIGIFRFAHMTSDATFGIISGTLAEGQQHFFFITVSFISVLTFTLASISVWWLVTNKIFSLVSSNLFMYNLMMVPNWFLIGSLSTFSFLFLSMDDRHLNRGLSPGPAREEDLVSDGST